MSRTDNHRPHRVQLADPTEKRWHRVSDAHEVSWSPLYRFGCRPGGCACGKWEWAQERRQRRHGERRLIERTLREY